VKKAALGSTADQKINANAVPSTPGSVSPGKWNFTLSQNSVDANEQGPLEPQSISNGAINAPLPYQNTPSVWTDSSFLTPYMRKYPALYKGLKFFYDGMHSY
jgi:hypothetical protein